MAATLCLALAGCGSTEGITQTAFERVASDAASIFAAAGVTLRFVHSDPASFSVEYGQGSMVNYDDQVSSLPEELPAAEGAPDQATVAELVDIARPAIAAIEDPCLLADCDYAAQIQALDNARDALLAATE